MPPAGEIVVVPFHSKGHTFPAIELSRHLATMGLSVTLFLPYQPSTPLHTNINVVLYSGPPPPPPAAPTANNQNPFLFPPPHLHEDNSLEDYLSKRSSSTSSSSSPPLLCAVVDVMMSHFIETCSRHEVPVVSFFTSSGCAAALEHAASKLSLEDLGSDGTFAVPGFPEDMVLTAPDLHPELPPPGGPQPVFGASDSDVGPWPSCVPPDPRCPPQPPLGWGHHGNPLPGPFGRCCTGGATQNVVPGNGGDPTPPPPSNGPAGCVAHPFIPHGNPGSRQIHHEPRHGSTQPPPRPEQHHHPGNLMRPFHPPPPPPHAPGSSPPWPPMLSPAHPPSPLPKLSERGTSCEAAAPAHRLGGGGPPRGLGETSGAAALLFNTCDELERPFLDYLEKEAGKPVWGVGPLLPARFWSTSDGPVSDEEARPDEQETTIAEGDIRAWLDSKTPVSVIYISFGTLVGPSAEELTELVAALEESDRPFIWVLQSAAMDPVGRSSAGGGSYFPYNLARRAKESGRGLIVRGWVPQLMILSHPSTAAFLSHCGWNSTVEALASGVPMLAWPVRGDQFYNAKLVTDRLRVGYPVRAAAGARDERVKKEAVARGIERLMADDGVRVRAGAVRSIFGAAFPESSLASVDAFVRFLTQRFKEASS